VALRLMGTLNRVGCSTGRSPGEQPRRYAAPVRGPRATAPRLPAAPRRRGDALLIAADGEGIFVVAGAALSRDVDTPTVRVRGSSKRPDPSRKRDGPGLVIASAGVNGQLKIYPTAQIIPPVRLRFSVSKPCWALSLRPTRES
jgi:hypothetical protein